MATPRRRLVFTLALAVGVAACGGNGPPGLSAPPAATDPVPWPKLEWTGNGVLAPEDLAEGESIVAVAAGTHGFVAIGDDIRSGTIRWSADGTDWVRVDDPAALANVYLVDVAAGPDGYVVVGTTTGDPQSPHPAKVVVVTSRDGRTWDRRREALGDARGHAASVSAGPSGYLLTADSTDAGVTAWRSRDGQIWEPMAPASMMEGGPVRPVADPHRGGWIALGPNVGSPVALHALPAGTWTSVPIDRGNYISAHHIAISSFGYLAIGRQGDCGPISECVEGPIAWASVNGVEWVRVPMDRLPFGMGSVHLGVSEAHGFVAVRGDLAWSSADGWTWAQITGPADDRFEVEDVVVAGDQIVAVGQRSLADGSQVGHIVVAWPALDVPE